VYGSHRTWALVPEDGEGVKFLGGWFVVAWHLFLKFVKEKKAEDLTKVQG
jgi:hypothetical protein